MTKTWQDDGMTWAVIERDNPQAVHCLTWNEERALAWIERYGDSKMFTDKTLTKDSFVVRPPTKA